MDYPRSRHVNYCSSYQMNVILPNSETGMIYLNPTICPLQWSERRCRLPERAMSGHIQYKKKIYRNRRVISNVAVTYSELLLFKSRRATYYDYAIEYTRVEYDALYRVTAYC